MPPPPKPEYLSILASANMQTTFDFSSPWPAVLGPTLAYSGTPKLFIANVFCMFEPVNAESYVDFHFDIHLRPTEPQLRITGDATGKRHWQIIWQPVSPPTSGVCQLGAAVIGGGVLKFFDIDLSTLLVLGLP